MIEVQNIYKTYQTDSEPLEVLKGVDLQIETGESVAVLGASGAGKSTLLHIMGTLDRPSQGKVRINGQEIFSFRESKLCEFRNQTIGFVFQFHHLLPMLTALENIMLPALIAGQSKKNAQQRAETLLEKVGLRPRRQHRPAELSGGEQQRVAIARALIMEPQVLLTDEPTGNLDSQTGEQVAQLLLNLHHEAKRTLIMVTHNEELAGRLSRKIFLSDGRLQPKSTG